MRAHLPALDYGRGDPAPARYLIRINGHLGATMLCAFPALVPRHYGEHSVLTGFLDQSALDGPLTPAEQEALDQLSTFGTAFAYANLQGTRPQTIGYDLADSPSGQAAWIYEKLGEWSDSDLDPDRLFGRDRILDDISLYWFTDTAASSARLYAESFTADFRTLDVDVPVGVSVFPHEIFRPPTIRAERAYSRLFYWNDAIPRAGHFAAFEQPGLFVTELRNCFRTLR
jgi:pimeloyl-ACP methyl ester carboxylesterase